MSKREANKLMGRIKRTRLNGRGLEACLSDMTKGVLGGSITVTEGNAVNLVVRQQLRKFDNELRAELKKREQ